MKSRLFSPTLTLLACSTLAPASAQTERARKGAAPPVAAPAASSAQPTMPNGPLKLWRVPTQTGLGATIWVEENSIKLSGDYTGYWALIIRDTDMPGAGRPAVGLWNYFSGQCSAGTQWVARATIIDGAGAQIASAIPPEQGSIKPPTGSSLAQALARGCGPAPAGSAPRATSVQTAINWSRNAAAWAAASGKAVASGPAVAAVAVPSMPVPKHQWTCEYSHAQVRLTAPMIPAPDLPVDKTFRNGTGWVTGHPMVSFELSKYEGRYRYSDATKVTHLDVRVDDVDYHRIANENGKATTISSDEYLVRTDDGDNDVKDEQSTFYIRKGSKRIYLGVPEDRQWSVTDENARLVLKISGKGWFAPDVYFRILSKGLDAAAKKGIAKSMAAPQTVRDLVPC